MTGEDEELLDIIIAGLKELAGPACSLGLDQLLRAERGEAEADVNGPLRPTE